MKYVVIFTVLLSIGSTSQADKPKTVSELVAEYREWRLAGERASAQPVRRCEPARRVQTRWTYQYTPYNSYNFPPGSYINSRINPASYYHYYRPSHRRRLR